MEFTSGHADFTMQQVLNLMDGIRVVFLNDAGSIYAVAKLDTTLEQVFESEGSETRLTVEKAETEATPYVFSAVENGTEYVMSYPGYDEETKTIKAPLELYSFSVDNNVLTLGTKSTDAIITALTQNTQMNVTALVYLDGDVVDNADVAIAGNSMSGTMNLQFASSANLDPMDYTFKEATETKGTLATPTVALDADGKTLTITPVTNATGYDIYVSGTDFTNSKVTSVTTTTYDLSTLPSEVPAGSYSITVVATATDYTASAASTAVSYTKS